MGFPGGNAWAPGGQTAYQKHGFEPFDIALTIFSFNCNRLARLAKLTSPAAAIC
jgi:hypothetical protein